MLSALDDQHLEFYTGFGALCEWKLQWHQYGGVTSGKGLEGSEDAIESLELVSQLPDGSGVVSEALDGLVQYLARLDCSGNNSYRA